MVIVHFPQAHHILGLISQKPEVNFSGVFFGGGSPVDLESVKISGSDSGILREGWEKSLTPSIYPLGGMGPPIFSLGVYRISTLLPNFTPLWQKLWYWGARQVFIFLNSNLQHEVWQRACTRANYCFYFILQATKFDKKNSRTGFWISSPFWRYGLPNFTNFLVNFCQKIHVGLVWGI